MYRRIMFTGCSGIGKTTLAKFVSEKFSIPFISGSYSDLVPDTKDQSHKDMINDETNVIVRKDHQVVALRHKSVANLDEYVSDRCYLDSMAYWIQKLSHRVSECDTTDFISLCKHLCKEDVDAIIYLPFTHLALTKWNMEENSKRVMNRWYQWQVSSIIDSLLALNNTTGDLAIAYRLYHNNTQLQNCHIIKLSFEEDKYIPVLVITDLDLVNRKTIIELFVSGQLTESIF